MLKHIKKSTFLLICLGMFVVLLGAMVLGINLGAVELRPDWISKIIVNNITGREVFLQEWGKSAQSIVWGMRFPKVIVCACVGAGLTLTGILMQAMTRNSLADPYILGISSGASTGATAILLMAGAFPIFQNITVGAGAFAGAMLSSVIVMILGGASGRFSPGKLVLSGTAVSAIFHAVTNLLIFLSPDKRKVSSALFWMEGSFSSAEWKDVLPAILTLAAIFCVAMLLNRSLDTLLLGEDIAITVGVNVHLMKLIIVVSSSLITGIMVSMSGCIGFVGLIVPHIARTMIGTVHRRMIPFAMLLGAIFMVLADMFARIIVAPSELPIGVVTALLGAPFFLAMLRKSGYSFSKYEQKYESDIKCKKSKFFGKGQRTHS